MRRLLVLALLLAGPAVAGEPVTVTCAAEAAALCEVEALATLAARVTRERDQVAAFLGLGTERPVGILVADSFRGRPVEVARAWPELGRMVIPPHILARGIAPTAHEVTHLLAGRGASEVLTEGLAVLTHARFGEQAAFPNFGQPLDAAAAALVQRQPLDTPPTLARLDAWIGDFENFAGRRLGYVIAGLFCEHLLLERLGGDRERFFRLYRGGDYQAVLGEPGEALFARWWAARAS